MKKLSMMILTMVAVLSFAVSAFAAPSPSMEWPYEPDGIEEATDENGNAIEIVIENVDLDAMDAVVREEINKILDGKFNQVPGLENIAFDGYTVKGMFELFLEENGSIVENADGTYDITVRVPNFKANGDYKILHRMNTGKWEDVQVLRKENGKFRGRFHTLSPVIILEKEVEAPSAGPGEDVPGDVPTGDNSQVALYVVAMLVAVVSMGVIGFSMKKEKK